MSNKAEGAGENRPLRPSDSLTAGAEYKSCALCCSSPLWWPWPWLRVGWRSACCDARQPLDRAGVVVALRLRVPFCSALLRVAVSGRPSCQVSAHLETAAVPWRGQWRHWFPGLGPNSGRGMDAEGSVQGCDRPGPSRPWVTPASASHVEPQPEPEQFELPAAPRATAAGGASDSSDEDQRSDDDADWSDADEGADRGEESDEFSDEGDEDGDEGYGSEEDGDEEHAFLVNQQADSVRGKVFTRTAQPAKEWRPSHLRPSLFADGPAVCAFGFCMAVDEELPEGLQLCPPELSRLTYKITQVGFRCVRQAFQSGGFVGLAKGSEWNALWGKIGMGQYKRLRGYQRINHFPGTWQLGRKDNLSRNCAKQRRNVGAALAANHPVVYHLPEDRSTLEREFMHARDPVFIIKPRASSRGRGIKLITSADQIPRSNKMLVQQYIPNPLTVDGYKCDIRVYVMVTSWDPLRVYINEDGLVRFATQKYKAGPKYYKRKHAHITNYSTNKESKNFVESTSESQGSKWSLQAFRRWLREVKGVDDAEVWEAMKDQCVRTIMATEGRQYQMYKQAEATGKCFEVWGFDCAYFSANNSHSCIRESLSDGMRFAVLLDDDLVPWVIEANTSPSLSSSGALDNRIKNQLIMDVLNIVGFVPVNRDEHKRTERVAKTPESYGLGAGGRPGSAFRGRAGGPVLSAQQRNARRRIVTAAATGRGQPGAVSREDAEQIVAQLTDEEREVLRMVEDEFERANTGSVSLKLAYPKPETAAQYAPLWESPRYYMTVLLAWLQSSRRAKVGHSALEDDFIPPVESTGRSGQKRVGTAAGSKSVGSASTVGRQLSKSGASTGPNLARIAGLASGGTTAAAAPLAEKADMRWLARQRAASGRTVPAAAATEPRRAPKTQLPPARRSATAPRVDVGKTKLVLRSSVTMGARGPEMAAPRVKGRPASGDGVVHMKHEAKGGTSRYGFDTAPIVGQAQRRGNEGGWSVAQVQQRRSLSALPGASGSASDRGAL